MILIAAALIPIAMLAVSLYVYFRYRHTQDGKRRSLILFILGVLASTFLAAMVIVSTFIHLGCSYNSGALCSFGVAVLVQPIAMFVGMVGYLYFWATTNAPDIHR